MTSKCRHIKVEIQGGETHCADCFDILAAKPKPARRRPTDTERLDTLLKASCRGGAMGIWLHGKWRVIETRKDIDKLLREEARRG